MDDASPDTAIAPVRTTFGGLLRDNRNFRLLWVGQTISQCGDAPSPDRP